MKKFLLFFIIFLIFFALGGWFVFEKITWYKMNKEARIAREAELAEKKAKEQAIEDVINNRRADNVGEESGDLFGDDNIVKILFVGLDKRTGQNEGHCDAIQSITINRKIKEVIITAVPRGTYSPLPPGKGATSSDYYVSNACALGGLDYGVKQIEKILGQKADYLIVVGFSEVLGILRNLQLPSVETLQWLRHRQGYKIGEPQRARNHSTFLKQMLIKYVSEKNSTIDKALQYVVYKMIKTDLTFAQAQVLADELSTMDLVNHSERIKLVMKPAYLVEDIPYEPEKVVSYVETMLNPIKNRLTPNEFTGLKEGDAQTKLLRLINEKKNNEEFILWAFENNIWLQIDENEKRLSLQYEFLEKYLSLLFTQQEREGVIADYILEMENRGEIFWIGKGKSLLALILGQ